MLLQYSLGSTALIVFDKFKIIYKAVLFVVKMKAVWQSAATE